MIFVLCSGQEMAGIAQAVSDDLARAESKANRKAELEAEKRRKELV